MEKQIKAEVIILYVSQAVALLAAAYCAWASSRAEAVLFYGRAAIAGNILLAVVIIANVWFVWRKILVFSDMTYTYLYIDESGTVRFMIWANEMCDEGKITKAELYDFVIKIREIGCWTKKLYKASFPFFFIDLTAMLEIAGFAFMKSVTEKRVCFSSMQGLAAFFVFAQIIWLHIASRHIYNSIKSWYDRKEAWLNALG